MTQRIKKTFIILGVLIAIVPFLGVPYSWKTILLIIFGLWVAVIAFFIDKDIKEFFNVDSIKIKKTPETKETKEENLRPAFVEENNKTKQSLAESLTNIEDTTNETQE